jgi:homoisocitrate dehydrogenase
MSTYTMPKQVDTFRKHGVSLPQATIDCAKSIKSVLFGACSSPSYAVDGYFFSDRALAPESYKRMPTLRPSRYLPVPTARPGVDMLVVRENTEDLYVGLETSEDSGDRVVAQKVITRQATERVSRLAYELAVSSGRRRVTIVTKANVLPQSDGLFRRVAYDMATHYPELKVDDLLVDTAAYWMVKEPTRFDIVLAPNPYW